jgi:restriction endonuclease
MNLSQHTKTLLSTINGASGKTLKRSLDLGALIEIAEQHSMHDELNDLAFSSKFIAKSFDLMQRIGKDGNGYEKLSQEFSSQIQKAQELIKQFLNRADALTKAHFAGNYLEMNTLTMQNLMQLFHDLGWYKNYQIDQRN